MNKKISLLSLAIFLAIPFAGCGVKAKKERHLQRANEFYEQKDLERARIEYMNAWRLDRANPDIIVKLGLVYYERGEYAPAYHFLTNALSLRPDNLTVRSHLATIYAVSGKYDEAKKLANQILEKDPGYGDALVVLATTALRTNEVKEVRTRLEKLVPTQPNNAFLQLALGNLYLKSREIKLAQDAFKKAQSLDDKNSRFHLALGSVYWLQGLTNEANAEYKAAADLAPAKSNERIRWADFKLRTGQVDEAKKILTEAITQAPDFIPGLNALAEILIGQKKYDEAVEYIQKVIAQEPNNYTALMNRGKLHMVKGEFPQAVETFEVLTKQYNDAQSHYQLANAYLGSKDNAKAMISLDQAIKINSNYVDAILLRSELQMRNRDAASAIPALAQLVQNVPNNPRAYYLLAGAYRSRGSIDTAIETYKKMDEFFPRDPQPSYLAGVLYRSQSNLVSARKEFEHSIAISPTFVPPIDELIELDVIEKKVDEAFKRAQNYVEKYPDAPTPRFLLGKIYASQNKVNEAQAALEKSLELDPNFQPAHQALVQIYLAQNKPADAIAKLQQMVDKNPKDVRSMLSIGMIYEGMNDRANARETYEKVLKLAPDSGPTMNNLAYILGEEGTDLDRAVQLATSAREIMRNDPYSADTLGWIYYKKGDYNRALEFIQESADKLGNQPDVLAHLGLTHYMLGNENQALDAFKRLAELRVSNALLSDLTNSIVVIRIDPTQADAAAISLLQKRVQDNPKDIMANLRLGQIFARQNDPDKAAASFEAARKANPKAAPVLVKYATFAMDNLGNSAKALELAREAWALNPPRTYALELGRVGVNAGDAKWALPVLLEAQSAAPDNPQISFYTALAYYAVGQISNAAENMNSVAKSKKEFPEHDAAKMIAPLFDVHANPALIGKAEASAAELAKRKPNFAPAYVALGLAAESRKDWVAARQQYETALKYNAALAPAQRQLAILLAEQLTGDDAALDLGLKAFPQFPGDAELCKALGKVSYRKGEYKDAVRYLRDSANNSTRDDADLLYHLGMAQYKLQDRQAKQSLTRALTLDKNMKMADEAQKALAELR